MRFFLTEWLPPFLAYSGASEPIVVPALTGPVLAPIKKSTMNKKLISWNEFDEAVAAQMPWLKQSWLAFTDAGVVLLSEDDKSEEPIFRETAKS
jgi:hypothetical protein